MLFRSWEKKLREIERKKYDARTFLEELKLMVYEIVKSVLSDNTNRRVTLMEEEKVAPKKRASSPKKRVKKEKVKEESAPAITELSEGSPCPLCGKGVVIKGKTAYGCSEWKSGCAFRKPFTQ